MRHPRSFPAYGLVVLWLGLAAGVTNVAPAFAHATAADNPDPLEGGIAWLNTGGPIKLKDLKGKVVLLDFWTYCCINCHHVLPDLARLEEKYKNELVVIGVHTPKFPAEQGTENIRQKVDEYAIKHPVVSDADQTIWNYFQVQSWPTLVLIDTQGNYVGRVAGEGHYEAIDKAVAKLVSEGKQAGTLNTTPLMFFPENEKPAATPLRYPGKVLADLPGRRLFVADTGHNRVIMSTLDGKNPVAIGNGDVGHADGPYDKATFHRPQGMAVVGDTLYVADTESHAIRAVDLKKKTVVTVAGNGKQAGYGKHSGPGKTTPLNSPWDLAHVASHPRELYIAMAGPHQIWSLNLETGFVGVFAGTGEENLLDGAVEKARFAQPSGLATDGQHLFIADSEVSALREISLGEGRHLVKTIVGEGLFAFGDVDTNTEGEPVRLQHCLGVAYGGGKLYVADTYNNKIKVCSPVAREVKTLVGDGKPGQKDQPAEFYQPGGLSVAGKTLYVADTNNHAVRTVNLETKAVATLAFDSLSPPTPRARKPVFPKPTLKDVAETKVAPGELLSVTVNLPIPEGFKLNDGGRAPYDVEAPDSPGLIDPKFVATGGKIDKPEKTFTVKIPLVKPTKAGDSFVLKVSTSALLCGEGSSVCVNKAYVWKVPVKVAAGGPDSVIIPAE